MSDENQKTHDKIEAINKSRMGTILMEHLGPLFVTENKMLIEQAKNSWRAGDFDKVITSIGALAALQDVENRIKSQINNGQRFMEGEFNA